MRLLPLLGLALVATASAAAAADAPPPNQRLVCTSERVTGSHLKKRVCITEEQREERRKADQEAMRNARRPTTAATPKGGEPKL